MNKCAKSHLIKVEMFIKGNRHTVLVAILVMWSMLTLHSLGISAITLSDPTFYNQYPFIIIVEDDEPVPSLTDEQFFDAAASVTFPVGVSQLPQNAPMLNKLRNVIIPQINADSLQLLRMVLRGAASPDGSVDLNRRLGNERVQALLQFFKQNMEFPLAEDMLSVDSEIEDYRSLCLMMKRANDPDYNTVKDLCDRYLGNDLPLLKQDLKATQGGRLWQRLLKDYFPQLRTARFIIILRKYNPKPEVVTIPMDTTPITPVIPIDTIIPIDTVSPIIPIETASPIMLTEAPDTIEQRRELLSVKTNLLFYAIYMPGYDRWCPIPNVALEYYPKRGHFTYGFSFDMPWWQDYDAHKYFQLRNYQLETRYYLRPSNSNAQSSNLKSQSSNLKSRPAFSGLYLQGYVHGGLFGICFDADRGWVGEGFGAGVGAGYVMPISRNGHWRLEFQLQAGFFRCKYDPYKYENPVNPAYHDDLYYYKWTLKPELFKKRQYRWNWLGPTRIGITLTYDLLYRRIHKRGMSFKSTERRAAYE